MTSFRISPVNLHLLLSFRNFLKLFSVVVPFHLTLNEHSRSLIGSKYVKNAKNERMSEVVLDRAPRPVHRNVLAILHSFAYLYLSLFLVISVCFLLPRLQDRQYYSGWKRLSCARDINVSNSSNFFHANRKF